MSFFGVLKRYICVPSKKKRTHAAVVVVTIAGGRGGWDCFFIFFFVCVCVLFCCFGYGKDMRSFGFVLFFLIGTVSCLLMIDSENMYSLIEMSGE